MSEIETKKETSTSSIIPDWSLLPDELLHLISMHLHNCFDVVHARSVCRSWRSTFPFPSSLLRQSYSLPSFSECSLESKDLCTLEKVPLFLFRVPSPASANAVSPFAYFLGEIRQDDYMELQSPLQCSVRVKIPRSEPTLMNILDCPIMIPLGHQYRIIDSKDNRVAFLPLDKEGKRGEFVVLFSCYKGLLVLTSAEMRWKRLENVPDSSCLNIVTYRGRFYATLQSGEIVVIDPYSLEVTFLLLSQPLEWMHYMVASGNDELFQVEIIIPRGGLSNLILRDVLNLKLISESAVRVSRLDEEAGKWVVVSDLGDRLLFIGTRNVSCSAKEVLPHGCGLSGNSILLFTRSSGNVIFSYKYGVHA